MYRSDSEELLTNLDDVLAANLSALPPASMQSGVAGIALYASLRSHASSGRALQRAVVATLRAAAVESGGGRLWTTPLEYAKGRGVEVIGDPVIEFGMVHGLGGALVGLAALAAQGDEEAIALLRGAIVAVWANAGEEGRRFSRILFGRGGALGKTEFAEPRWCVGDAGTLRALWIAARTLGEVVHAERARIELRAEAARDVEADRYKGEINLCCGAGAVAQVYLRMYRETGDPVFGDANRTLLARCEAGFENHVDPSFAYGKMGVLLALVAAASGRDDDSRWDGMLGMSLPRALSVEG
jgi:hypothetical protein